MRILIVLDAGSGRNWHAALAEALRLDGHEVAFGFAPAALPAKAATLLYAIERRLYHVPAENAFAAAALAENHGFAGDLAIDLASQPWSGPSCLVPLYDGRRGEAAALEAVLAQRSPIVSVDWQRSGQPARIMACGTPGIERPDVATLAMGFIMTRTASLLRQAVTRMLRGDGPVASPTQPQPAARPIRSFASAPLAFAAGQIAGKVTRRLARLAQRQGHWRVGWRRDQDGGVVKNLAWPKSGYQTLPDDSQRYYADPFLFQHQGQMHLFVEEFPYATGKGIISAAIIAADGRIGTPKIVLERPYHLSYPQVFEQDGTIYMIPETGGNRTIELFRAVDFPNQWVLEAVLVDNVLAGDATYLLHEGRHWLFASITEEGGSTWDQLGLFHAPTLHGPWTAHVANPVLTDASAARPAGQMQVIDGKIWRCAQNCSVGYGRGITIATVDRLDTDGYAQTVHRHLPPDPAWRMQAVHSLNILDGVEVVDYFA